MLPQWGRDLSFFQKKERIIMRKNIFTTLVLFVVLFNTVALAEAGSLFSSLPETIIGTAFSGGNLRDKALRGLKRGAKSYLRNAAKEQDTNPRSTMDAYDYEQISNILETAASATTKMWKNPYTLKSYRAIAKPAYKRNGKICRNVVVRLGSSAKHQVELTAYRLANGNWHIG